MSMYSHLYWQYNFGVIFYSHTNMSSNSYFKKWYILRCRDIIFQNTLNEPYVKLIQIMENHADFSNILNKNLGGIKRYNKDWKPVTRRHSKIRQTDRGSICRISRNRRNNSTWWPHQIFRDHYWILLSDGYIICNLRKIWRLPCILG